jgi:hypothetical protein
MYRIYPFEANDMETLYVSITEGKMTVPPKKLQEQYSEGLKDIVSLLLSQVFFITI